MTAKTETIALLDVGGEGRYATAMNLNPSPTKTLGPDKGEPIPNRIEGRAENIPLADNTVQTIVVERTPLRNEAIEEILRCASEDATLIFRFASDQHACPSQRIRQRIAGKMRHSDIELAGQTLSQLIVQVPRLKR